MNDNGSDILSTVHVKLKKKTSHTNTNIMLAPITLYFHLVTTLLLLLFARTNFIVNFAKIKYPPKFVTVTLINREHHYTIGGLELDHVLG